jgi:putative addiction module killer protein
VFEVFRYQTESGTQPFTEWLESIQDKATQARLRVRLRRLEAGLFGDCEPVGDGVLELREHHAAGYRIYFGRHRRTIVILLTGGTKRTQSRDIEAAKSYWADWNRRKP